MHSAGMDSVPVRGRKTCKSEKPKVNGVQNPEGPRSNFHHPGLFSCAQTRTGGHGGVGSRELPGVETPNSL